MIVQSVSSRISHLGCLWVYLVVLAQCNCCWGQFIPVPSIMGAEVAHSSSTSQLSRGPYDGQQYSSRINYKLEPFIGSIASRWEPFKVVLLLRKAESSALKHPLMQLKPALLLLQHWGLRYWEGKRWLLFEVPPTWTSVAGLQREAAISCWSSALVLSTANKAVGLVAKELIQQSP